MTRRRRNLGTLLVLSALLLTVNDAAAASFSATVIDRSGDRYEVRNLTYQKQPEFEVYSGGRRQLIRFRDITRIVLGGNVNDREIPVVIDLRDGQKLEGQMYAGSSGGASPHRSVVSGPATGGGFSGRSELGPVAIQLIDVRDLRFHHDDAAQASVSLRATLVDLEGKRFEVETLRFRGRTDFLYDQGRKHRTKALSSIDRIEFTQAPRATESRAVAITFRSGKVAHGTADASTIRVPGETDRLFEQRVFEAFTGSAGGAPFAIGLHQIRLLRLEWEQDQSTPPSPGPSTSP
ncbi:MAG: hypothetical protein HN712_05435 [Gemmatimonadetes bacterium]|nr:hypothetical protein [Gemmatimonadota bacterium]MBT6144151.1 hypothetical protein [Gemmatimonadota bacterium]MBT7859731.1 hypothetical protein [Gemmatimonadota bacterium]